MAGGVDVQRVGVRRRRASCGSPATRSRTWCTRSTGGSTATCSAATWKQVRRWRGELEKIIAESKSEPRAASTLPLLDARQLVETEAWKVVPLDDEMPTSAIFATGLSAAKLGDLAVARRAAALLATRAKQPDDRYDGGGESASVMRLEIEALVLLAKGRRDAALAALEEGRAIAESMGPPAGPASPVKPIHELYGEVLLEIGRPERAAELFQASLDRTPERPLSLRGLARAQELAGQTERSRETWSRLLAIRENRPAAIGVEEARRALAAVPSPSPAPTGVQQESTPRSNGKPGHAHGEHP